MAAITAVHTLAAVALMLGVSDELLYDLIIDMEPEDGCISVYGTREEHTPAFTVDGIEYLRGLIADQAQLNLPLGRA